MSVHIEVYLYIILLASGPVCASLILVLIVSTEATPTLRLCIAINSPLLVEHWSHGRACTEPSCRKLQWAHVFRHKVSDPSHYRDTMSLLAEALTSCYFIVILVVLCCELLSFLRKWHVAQHRSARSRDLTYSFELWEGRRRCGTIAGHTGLIETYGSTRDPAVRGQE